MKIINSYFLLTLISGLYTTQTFAGNTVLLNKDKNIGYATLVNDYFMTSYPDVGAKSYVGGKERDSKIWTRGVYYEGLRALHRQIPNEKWRKYAVDWGEYQKWQTDGDKGKRHAR